MSVPVLNLLLIDCRIDLAAVAAAIHERSLPGPTSVARGRPASETTQVTSSVSPNGVHPLPAAARQTQHLEPILFPKLRIYFADFPYLHCSMGQRLLTLETCCGYEYDRTRKSFTPSGFQGPSRAHRTPQDVWRFTGRPTLAPGKPISGSSAPVKKKRELFPGPSPAFPSSVASPLLPQGGNIRVPVREY